jgi:HEAT repeat protein
MAYDEQYSNDHQSAPESSSTENVVSQNPFVSIVLARLGLEDSYIEKDSSMVTLLIALNSPEWRVRAEAAHKLGKMGEKTAVEPLATVLINDSEAAVRVAAARALGELTDYTPVEHLIAALDDPRDDVKAAVAWSLGEMGEHISASTSLENLLNNENTSVRVAAIRALGEMGERTPLHVLVAALRDPDWEVREMATLALGKRGEPGAKDVLESVLDDESEFVRKVAMRALVMIEGRAGPGQDPRKGFSGETQGDSFPTGVPNNY